MKRKAIVVGMIVSMCFVMTACGEEEGKTEGGKDGKTTITFQTWNPGEGAAIDEVIAAFEEKNPDIKINHVYMPYSDHMQKLKVDLASGGGPDVYGMQTGASLTEFRDFEMELGAYAKEQYGDDWSSDYKEFAMNMENTMHFLWD